MSELNKIFYGPAGTGKTRETIIEAVKIVNEKLNKELGDYESIQNTFNGFSEAPEAPTKNRTLINKMKDFDKDLKTVGADLKEYEIIDLAGEDNRDKAKEKIKEYRESFSSYPLIETVTFHPSYSYQDFVEGISVDTKEIENKNKEKSNELVYQVKDGVFKKICERAMAKGNEKYNYVLIIDEINRGDISSIFGELFTLLEDSKRKGNREELFINLPYSKDKNGNPKKLVVPKNLHILATMNTVDKSIALIDVALRRRFEFIECLPKTDIPELKEFNEIDLPKFLKAINERISILKNEHYQIGHSYFLNIKDFSDFKNVMKKKIIPLLQEYFYDDWQSICAVLNQSYKNPQENKILISNQSKKNPFLKEFDELREFRNKNILKLSKEYTQNDIKKVYE